jgi:riboflavin kinase/FMN adenylyltransferase
LSEAKRSQNDSSGTIATPNQWYSSIVQHGDKYGRTLGFPTANLDPAVLKHVTEDGVYACTVHLGREKYRGALYLGPRIVLHETKRVLEIHIINFAQEVYGETLQFQLGPFIRPPLDFQSRDDLVQQLGADTTHAATIVFD